MAVVAVKQVALEVVRSDLDLVVQLVEVGHVRRGDEVNLATNALDLPPCLKFVFHGLDVRGAN